MGSWPVTGGGPLPGLGTAGRDAEGEQGGVVAGPAAGVPGQDLAEVADRGDGVQAVGAGQGIGQGVLAEQRADSFRRASPGASSLACAAPAVAAIITVPNGPGDGLPDDHAALGRTAGI